MLLDNKKIGFALTGSFCTLAAVIPQIRTLLTEGADIIPIVSESVKEYDTRFGSAKDWLAQLEELTGHKPIDSIVAAEPIGPKKLLDLLIVAPCTGNTLGKLAAGITDNTVTMACKAHLRNQRPLLLTIATNDALAASAGNIGRLLNTKHIFFVPYRQDDPIVKCNSMVADMNLILPAAVAALEHRQLEPVVL